MSNSRLYFDTTRRIPAKCVGHLLDKICYILLFRKKTWKGIAKMRNKRIAALLICILMIGTGLFGCTKTEPERIGIVSAMDNEVALLLQEAKIDRVDTFGGVDFHVGTLRGQPVVIMRSGIGKVLSASAMTAMLNRYSISEVIFTGIAGGVGDETQVLDQVIATRLVQHDYGTMTNDGFVWANGVTDEEAGEKDYYFCDPTLVDLAYNCAVEVIGKEHVFKGTIATGDQFVASEAYVKTLQTQFNAIACEMEGASIAAVCTQYQVPFVVIRCMSDKEGQPIRQKKKLDALRVNKIRCILAIIVSAVLCALTFLGVCMQLLDDPNPEIQEVGWKSYHLFTILSNMLMAAAAAMCIPYAVDGLRNHNYHLPRWYVDLMFTGTVGVAVTFLVAVAVLSPAAGFYREHSTDVPVFPNVTSVQNFDLIPLPAGADEPLPDGDITFYNNMQQYQIPVTINAGATIDFLAGNKKRAPKWMVDNGLEWLYRTLQEPKRVGKRVLTDLNIFPMAWKYKQKTKRGQ